MSGSCRVSRLIVLTCLALLIAASCGSDNGRQGNQSGGGDSAGGGDSTGAAQGSSTMMGGETTMMGGGTTMMSGGETTGMGASGGGSPGQAKGGTWQVDGAGTVVFQTQGGSLNLQNSSANSGWNKRVAANTNDEIEIHFTKGNTDWKFEAELDDDGLEISRERDTQPADDGTYQVGDAAEVRFSSDGGSLSLDDVSTKSGWNLTSRDVSADDIEIDFKKGRQTAEFEVEKSRGQTKLEISQKVTGPAPS